MLNVMSRLLNLKKIDQLYPNRAKYTPLTYKYTLNVYNKMHPTVMKYRETEKRITKAILSSLSKIFILSLIRQWQLYLEGTHLKWSYVMICKLIPQIYRSFSFHYLCIVFISLFEMKRFHSTICASSSQFINTHCTFPT